MFDRLDDLLIRYEELMEELGSPEVASDTNRFRKLMKEQSDLAPIVEAYKEYKKAKQDVEDSLALLDEESDEEMREMAKEELNAAKKRIEELEQELKILLLPKDPNDEKNVIVEIRAGAGGDEAALFASELYRMYVRFAERNRWKTELVSVSENGIGGFKEVVFMITGQGAYSKMKYESGVHRVQRVPETESGGRIHTSTATVAVMPEAEEVETLKWMIDCIQEVTDLPISIDSPSPDVLAQAYKFCKKPGIFNSVSGEGHKIDTIFPIMAEPGNEGWQVIALLSDNTGIPKCAADRLKVFDKIMAKAKEYGIAPDRIHIDPLVEMLCTSEDGIATNIETITSVREQYPTIHITAAISNISFNLPVRKLINYGFLVLAMNAGLDSGIMDPTNKDMLGLVYATEALLGLDDYCMEYIGAYREGLIGTTKKK